MNLENEKSQEHLIRVLNNLQVALDILSRAPLQKINLNSFGTQTECGTLYCAAGWLATSDEFKDRMMLVWLHRGEEYHATLINPTGDGYLGEWLDEIFGPEAYSLLFIYAGGSPFDRAFVTCTLRATHKAMALNRFKQRILQVQRRLEELEVPA